MRSRLRDNGLYETSRMMLPEHIEAWLAQEELQKKRGKPDLDEQEKQHIAGVLEESYKRECTIDLVLFNPFFDESLSGIVVGYNVDRHEVNLMLDEDFRPISIAEIISASV